MLVSLPLKIVEHRASLLAAYVRDTAASDLHGRKDASGARTSACTAALIESVMSPNSSTGCDPVKPAIQFAPR